MGILLVSFLLAVVFFVWGRVIKVSSCDINVPETISVMLAVVFVGAVIVISVGRMDARTSLVKIEQTRQTIETARCGDVSDIELAALQHEVVECNEWLAEARYWQKNWWIGWFYLPDVQDVEYLR